MKGQTYNIFCGLHEEGAVWLDGSDGLEEACERMREHAQRLPGHYFVLCAETQKIAASTDSSQALPRERQP
jgi:hypothetical protein